MPSGLVPVRILSENQKRVINLFPPRLLVPPAASEGWDAHTAPRIAFGFFYSLRKTHKYFRNSHKEIANHVRLQRRPNPFTFMTNNDIGSRLPLVSTCCSKADPRAALKCLPSVQHPGLFTIHILAGKPTMARSRRPSPSLQPAGRLYTLPFVQGFR